MVQGYNFYNIEASFRQFLLAVNSGTQKGTFSKPLSKISVKNYLSDFRYFMGWYVLYLKSSGKGGEFEYPFQIVNELKFLDIETVQAYRRYLASNKLPEATINRRLSALRKFCSFCMAEGWLEENPAKDVPNLIEFNRLSDSHKPKNKPLVKIAPIIQRLHEWEEREKIMLSRLHLYKKNVSLAFIAGFTFMVILAIGLLTQSRKPVATAKEKPSSTRTLSFQGRLADKLGAPIFVPTKVQFKLYKNSRSSQPIYSSGVCTITPDIEGNVALVIGKDCGTQVANSIFTDNQNVYLGITIGTDPEMKPRQEITNTGLAANANTLQGLPVGSKPGSIPFIDQTGTLLIATSSPTLKSDSGNFTLQGKALILSTTPQSAGDINLAPATGGNVLVTSGNFSVGNGFQINSEGSLMKMNAVDYFWPSLQGAKDSVLTNDGLGNLTWMPGTPNGWKDEGTIVGLASNTDSVSIGATSTTAKVQISGTLDQTQFIVKANSTQTTPLVDVQGSNGRSLFSIGPSGAVTASVDMFINSQNLSSNSQIFNLFGTEVKTLNIGASTNSLNLGSITGLTSIKNNLSVSGLTGIGTSNPGAKLEVAGGQTKLEVSTQYNQRLCHSGTDISSAQGVYIGDCSGGGADIAEYYGSDDTSIEAGDVVIAAEEAHMTGLDSKAYVKKSTSVNQTGLLGIVSTNPYDSFGKNFTTSEYSVPVALVGRVPVKISPHSKAIQAGDFITSSDIPGRATKAEKAGVVIGKALEKWDPITASGEAPKDKIIVFVQLGWADPTLYLTQNGDVQVPSDEKNSQNSTYNGLLSPDHTSAADELSFRANAIIFGLLEAKNVIAEKISARTIVSERIVSPVVESENIAATGTAELSSIKTKSIQGQNGDLTIDLGAGDQEGRDPGSAEVTSTDGKDIEGRTRSDNKGDFARLIIKGFENKEVASVDAAGNASFSGTIAAQEIRTDKITAKEIESDTTKALQERLTKLANQTTEERSSFTRELANSSTNINDIQKMLADLKNQPLATPQASLALNSNETMNLTDLNVSGVANLYSAFVNTSLGVGNIMVQNDEVRSMAQELKLSALSQINFFNAKVLITQDGSITTEGKITAKGGLTLQNSKLEIRNSSDNEVASIDSSGSAQLRDLSVDMLRIKNKYLEATDSASVVAEIAGPAIHARSEQAGTGVLPASTQEVTIYTTAVQKDSLVYLTPTTPLVGGQLAMTHKETCLTADSSCQPFFKVTSSVVNPTEIKFNWLIIN